MNSYNKKIYNLQLPPIAEIQLNKTKQDILIINNSTNEVFNFDLKSQNVLDKDGFKKPYLNINLQRSINKMIEQQCKFFIFIHINNDDLNFYYVDLNYFINNSVVINGKDPYRQLSISKLLKELQ